MAYIRLAGDLPRLVLLAALLLPCLAAAQLAPCPDCRDIAAQVEALQRAVEAFQAQARARAREAAEAERRADEAKRRLAALERQLAALQGEGGSSFDPASGITVTSVTNADGTVTVTTVAANGRVLERRTRDRRDASRLRDEIARARARSEQATGDAAKARERQAEADEQVEKTAAELRDAEARLADCLDRCRKRAGLGGWPGKWSGPGLNAKNAETALETLEPSSEGIELAPDPGKPPPAAPPPAMAPKPSKTPAKAPSGRIPAEDRLPGGWTGPPGAGLGWLFFGDPTDDTVISGASLGVTPRAEHVECPDCTPAAQKVQALARQLNDVGNRLSRIAEETRQIRVENRKIWKEIEHLQLNLPHMKGQEREAARAAIRALENRLDPLIERLKALRFERRDLEDRREWLELDWRDARLELERCKAERCRTGVRLEGVIGQGGVNPLDPGNPLGVGTTGGEPLPPPPPPQPGAPGTVQFSSASYETAEGRGQVTITVTRSGGATGPASVRYVTASRTASGSDFVGASALLSWDDGDASPRTFTIGIVDDTQVEEPETFEVRLSDDQGRTAIGAPATATVTIADNDAAAPVGPCGAAGSAWQPIAGTFACSGTCDPCPTPQRLTVDGQRVTIAPFHAGGAATFTGCGSPASSDSNGLVYFGQANHSATLTRQGNGYRADIRSGGGGSCVLSCTRTGP